MVHISHQNVYHSSHNVGYQITSRYVCQSRFYKLDLLRNIVVLLQGIPYIYLCVTYITDGILSNTDRSSIRTCKSVDNQQCKDRAINSTRNISSHFTSQYSLKAWFSCMAIPITILATIKLLFPITTIANNKILLYVFDHAFQIDVTRRQFSCELTQCNLFK